MTKAPPKTGGKKTKQGGNVEVGERFKRMLPVPINAKRAQEKRDRCFDIDEEIIVEQTKMEPFKTRVRELQAEGRKLHEDVKTQTEDREVNCVEERDYSKREVRVLRIDTRQVVESRTMTDADRSPELPVLAKGDKRPAPPPPAEAIAEARKEDKPRTPLASVPKPAAKPAPTPPDDDGDELTTGQSGS